MILVGLEVVEGQEKKERSTSGRIACSTYAGNELMKGEKGGEFPGGLGGGTSRAANGIVRVILALCVEVCMCAPGAHVCVCVCVAEISLQ